MLASFLNVERAGVAHRAANRSQGSLINIATEPGYAELVAAPEILNGLAGLGFCDLRFQSGFLISKPGNSPALFWHQDWWGWSLESSYLARPQQIGVMVYLSRTSVANGCLRVLPGSHLRSHRLHGSITAHDAGLSRVDDERHELYQSVQGEVALPSKPGDVLVIDARILHSAYPNTTDQERMLLTLWYHPFWPELPQSVRAHAADEFDREVTDVTQFRDQTHRCWPPIAVKKIAALVPDRPDGPQVEFNRRPDTSRMEAWRD
ncbi:MAG: phytanoyl-CoA dioxygenase family protein [Boseongicola sp. SB0676_bin_33]|nr:phytanoyl-CoA dioxygenase family protein [Boseongicola sp. SB0676_bin_33]